MASSLGIPADDVDVSIDTSNGVTTVTFTINGDYLSQTQSSGFSSLLEQKILAIPGLSDSWVTSSNKSF